ncbi:glycosyl hydrolase family 17 protein, partial [Mycobacterium tuberculosis]|uniref:glycosyl hydrolase family 17 protein n=1 Tax=Mycobacterium tuberculosis TaxID=1773 RepID=UPI003C6DF770
MVNPYPYFGYGYSAAKLNYATFRPNPGMYDPVTKIRYMNMFDAQMDAVHTAMRKLGYGDVEIVVGETGWPTAGEPGQVGADPESA